MRDPHFHRHLIVWLWCAWALYWVLTALSTKTTVRRQSPTSRIGYVAALAAGAVLIAWPWSWLGVRLWPRSFGAYWFGVAVLAAGLAFSVWARVHLGRNWSGSVTVKEGHELIRTGPYALVRHPIYTGLIIAVAGTAITSGTVRALLGLAIVAASLAWKLRAEESFMRETFRGEYERYSAQVPALIPFTKPRQSAPR
ncbi:MAG TPA: isoprenylcysteine carboxylmethyltransferase family protein [Steroidobacteraceae bacterium]|nr:isoprenylcysteine carboxylmethyltransferase family protein [Steroidobacteraceae bacterium]